MLFSLGARPALIPEDCELRFALRPPLPPFIGEILLLLPDGPFVLALARVDRGENPDDPPGAGGMVERSPAGTSRRVLIEPMEAGMGSDARSEA